MTQDSREFRTDPDVIAQSVGEETVFLDMRSAQYLGLNQVGSAIWKALEAGRSLAEIRSQLVASYPDASPEQIATDIDKLITKLLDHKLIHAD